MFSRCASLRGPVLRVPAEGWRHLLERGHPTGAEHVPDPEGRANSESKSKVLEGLRLEIPQANVVAGSRGNRGGRVREPPGEPGNRPVPDPRRPGTAGGSQQSAEASRADRKAVEPRSGASILIS